jgi:hypothetical protein
MTVDIEAEEYEVESVDLLGDLTLQSVEVARNQLVAALKNNPRLSVRLESDALVDLAGVQLLEAVRKSAAAAGGDVGLTDAATGGLLETLGRGGFLQSPQQRQFWLKEEA